MSQSSELDWEKQLQDVHQQYQTLLGYVTDLLLVANEKGEITFVSPNVERWLGYCPAQMPGLGLIQDLWLDVQGDRDQFEGSIINKTGDRCRFQVRVHGVTIAGGTRLYCCSPLFSTADESRGIASQGSPHSQIIPLPETQTNLSRDRALLDAIFEGIPHIIWVKEAQTRRFVRLNHAGKVWLDIEGDRVLGKTNQEILPADLATEFEQQEQEVLKQQNPLTISGILLKSPQFGKRWLDLHTLPIFDETGKVQYIVGILEDVSDRASYQKALQESETTTRALFDAIPDLLLRLKADGTYIACKAAKKFKTMFPPAEMIGKQPEDVLPPDAAAATRYYCQLALATQETQVYEYSLSERGRIRHYEARVIACGDDEVLKIVRDISDRVAAEQALQESENRFRAIFDQAAVGMTILTLDYRFFRINQKFSEITGYSHIELLIQDYFDIVHSEDRAAHQSCIESLQSGERATVQLESRYLHKDETTVWVNLSLSAIRDENDEVQYIIAVIQNISDRVFAEAALQDAYRILTSREQQYRTLTDRAPVGIFQTNTEGNVTFVNPCWCEITGLDQPQALGDGWKQALHPDDRDRALTQWQKLPEDRQENFEFRFQRPDGSVTWVMTNSSSLRDEKNQYQGEIGTIRDITERKNAEVALTQQNEILQTIFDHIPIMVIFFNAQGQLQLLNRETENVLGWSLAEARQLDLFAACCPDPAQREVITQFINQAESKWRDFTIMTRTGAPLETAWASIRLSDETRFVIGQDISDRKRAEEHLKSQAEREKLIGSMQVRIHRSLDINTIINTTVEEVRNFLQCDRVLVYRFNPDWSGEIIAESTLLEGSSVVGRTLDDSDFTPSLIERYQEGQIHYYDEIESCLLSSGHTQLFSPLQVKANLVIPILQQGRLWGLLNAQHCIDSHHWQESEIKFLQQLATQVGIAIQQSQLYGQLKKANLELHRLATIDGLTKVANRRCFDAYLQAEWRRMARLNHPLAVILSDIDYFKLYNDTYGHQAGDICLQKVAAALQRTVKRPADLVARYGGEEFVAILPNTDAEGATHIARTIREETNALKIPHCASLVHDYVTLSLGVAVIVPTVETSPYELIEKADGALYRAKDAGRDRVICAEVE